MIVIDRQTGLPVDLIPARQQPGLSVGQAIGGILFVVGAATFISEVADAVGALFNPTKTKRRGARPVLEEDDLSDLEWIFYRTDGECFYCGKKLCMNNRGFYGGKSAWEADHFVPFSRRGADQPYNFVAACVGCNRAKANLWPWQFDDRIQPGDRNPENYL
jgi:5-methylcytosine-specific restriction endonuclease McrA